MEDPVPMSLGGGGLLGTVPVGVVLLPGVQGVAAVAEVGHGAQRRIPIGVEHGNDGLRIRAGGGERQQVG